MKKTLAFIGMAVAVIGLAVAPSANALTLTIDRVAGHYYGDGGEFNIAGTGYQVYYNSLATAYNRYGQIGFESFCVEESEPVNIPAVYDYAINPAGAVGGGVAGGNPDPVSAGTAWLYSQFAAGTLSGYNYTVGAGRVVSARDLQECIWFLENEILTVSGGNTFYAAVLANFSTLAAAQADDTIGIVQAMNLTQPRTGDLRQSQLVITRRAPDAAATVALLGLALTGIGLVSRKSR